jgi:hypothetical protein
VPGANTPAITSAAALDHVFVLLSLVLEREPLQIASRALRGEDPGLKGTALEYLGNVLPHDVGALLLARIGVGGTGRSGRPRHELLAELLRSGKGFAVARNMLRRRSLRPRG